MSGFPIVDLILGMVFVYFLLSVISSSIVEMALTYVKARSRLLEDWLKSIFDKETEVGDKKISLGQAIMDHCSVTVLTEKGKAPSYIDAKNFTSALLEKLSFDPDKPNEIAKDLGTFIAKLNATDILSTELKRLFLTYAYEARDKILAAGNLAISDLELFRSKIENWYDTSMDRLTGDLKRKYSRPFTLIVAIITALLLNADSVNIAKYLYSNPDARAAVAAQAYGMADSTGADLNKRIDTIKIEDSATTAEFKTAMKAGLDNIEKAKAALYEDLPFGWTSKSFSDMFGTGSFFSGFLAVLLKICGLAVTVFAIMMGAPFWFDLLNKVANLRSTGKKPPSTTGNDLAASAPAVQTAPAISINTNTDEEAVG